MARATFWIVLTAALLCGALLVLPRYLGPPQLGQAIVGVTVIYLALLFAGAYLGSQQQELRDALAFLVPLGLFLVLPDTLLVQKLGVLTFPDLGAQRFGPVPVYMAGLWVAPLLVVLWLAQLAHRVAAVLAGLVALVVALGVFAAAEWAAHIPALWYPRNVATWHGIALYALPAEGLLGLLTWLVFTQVQRHTLFGKAFGAAVVALCYTGALFASHLAFQRLA